MSTIDITVTLPAAQAVALSQVANVPEWLAHQGLLRSRPALEVLKRSESWKAAEEGWKGEHPDDTPDDDAIALWGREHGLLLTMLEQAEEERLASLPTLEELRLQTFLGKFDFCMAMAGIGVLSGESALEAAKDNWPVEFNPFLEPLTENQRLAAKGSWIKATQVGRSHHLLLQLKAYTAELAEAGAIPKAVTDEDLDAIFGITSDMYKS